MNVRPRRLLPPILVLAVLASAAGALGAFAASPLHAQVSGSEIVYVDLLDGIPKDLRKMDVNGNSQRLFSGCMVSARLCTLHDPALSPEGGRVALVANHENESGNNYSVWITTLSGGGKKQVSTAASSSAARPAWSPDSRYLAFQRGSGIHEIDLCRDRLPSAGRLVVQGTSPSYSPDGRWIAYASAGSIWKVRRTGGTPVQLHGISLEQKDPRWTKPSASTEQITFLQRMFDGYRLYTMNPDGSSATQRVTTGGAMESPDAALLPNVFTWEQDRAVYVQIGSNPPKRIRDGRDPSFGAGTRRLKTICP